MAMLGPLERRRQDPAPQVATEIREQLGSSCCPWNLFPGVTEVLVGPRVVSSDQWVASLCWGLHGEVRAPPLSPSPAWAAMWDGSMVP